MRDRPASRRRRFDEGILGAVLITSGGLALTGLLFGLGWALRVVDDQRPDLSED